MDYGFGPGGPVHHLPGVLRPRRKSHGRGRPRPPPRPLLLSPRLSPRYPFRPTATAQSLWELLPSASSWRHADCTYKVKCTLGDDAELQFADAVARCSHPDWEREQQAEPACHTAMRYIIISRPPALPPDFLSCYPSHQRPSLSDIQELAGKGRLHTTNDDIALLVGNPTPPPTSDAAVAGVNTVAVGACTSEGVSP